MALGKQVRRYRTGLGLTLEKLAELSEVEVGTISALEQRDSRRSEYGSPLAKAFGLTLEELLDETADHLPDLKAGRRPSGQQKVAESAPPAYLIPWPFAAVSRAEWHSLDETERALAETYIRGLIDGKKRPRKSRASAGM